MSNSSLFSQGPQGLCHCHDSKWSVSIHVFTQKELRLVREGKRLVDQREPTAGILSSITDSIGWLSLPQRFLSGGRKRWKWEWLPGVPLALPLFLLPSLRSKETCTKETSAEERDWVVSCNEQKTYLEYIELKENWNLCLVSLFTDAVAQYAGIRFSSNEIIPTSNVQVKMLIWFWSYV